MATQQQKTRSRSARSEQLLHEQNLRNAAIDTEIRAFADEQRAGAIVAVIAGVALGCLLVWTELVMLWAMSHV
jgi:hypothetical protein